MAALGRIPGTQLNDNLIRNGVDLTFRNGIHDTDLLYLDVSNGRIGVNREAPVYGLDVSGTTRTKWLEVDDQASLGTIIVDSRGFFTTTYGPINISPDNDSHWPPIVEYEHVTTDLLDFQYTTISTTLTNSDLILDSADPARVVFRGRSDSTNPFWILSAQVNGNLDVTGDITVDGNLLKKGNIIIGNEVYEPDTGVGDTVEVNTDFTQHIIPGDDNKWELGADGRIDSSPQRWKKVWAEDIQNVDNVGNLYELRFNQGLVIDGVDREIRTPTNNKNIAHIERSNPVRVVTTRTHNYVDGQQVRIYDTGVRQIDDNVYYIKSASPNEFDLYTNSTLTATVNGAGYDSYPSGGGRVEHYPNSIIITPSSGYTSIENLKFRDNSSAPIMIVNIELAKKTRVDTLGAHNYIDGQSVRITQTGLASLDLKDFYVKVLSSQEFYLYRDQGLTVPVDGRSFGSYPSSGGYSQGYSDITPLTSDPVTFASTNNGYWQFASSTAIVIPSGKTNQRPTNPELGDTRWNTDLDYLECFDGNSYVIATGGGAEVTQNLMQEIADIWALTLG